MSNLLVNGAFEGGYVPFQGIGELQIAAGWSPWWSSPRAGDEPWKLRRPEYKPAAPFEDRIHSGANAQQWFSFTATHSAGVLQRVAVPRGARLRLRAWSQVWSSNEDDPGYSGSPENAIPNGHLETRIGLDLNGGVVADAPEVAWSPWCECYDRWVETSLEGTANADYVTVFLRSECMYPVKHNDVYFDDVSLEVVGEETEGNTVVIELRKIVQILHEINITLKT